MAQRRAGGAQRAYAARKRLDRLPSLLEFFSYLFAAGNLLASERTIEAMVPAFERSAALPLAGAARD